MRSVSKESSENYDLARFQFRNSTYTEEKIITNHHCTIDSSKVKNKLRSIPNKKTMNRENNPNQMIKQRVPCEIGSSDTVDADLAIMKSMGLPLSFGTSK